MNERSCAAKRKELQRVSFPFLKAVCLCLCLTGFRAIANRAQEKQPIIERPESGLALRNDAQPLRFFDATGRKAAVLGRQNGQFEAWIYPIKLLHGFRLEFHHEGQLQPVRGETILRQVVTRPESTTLVYVHPDFTVREILWTPLNDPAVVIDFEVDSAKPLEISAAFVPDFKPMWPASFGGQHSFWNAKENAFVLTDGTEKPTALLGSPAVIAASEFTDHQLASGEMMMLMRFTPGQARQQLAPLVMSMSLESASEATAIYHDVLSRAKELFAKRLAYHQEFLAKTLSFESPDAELNRDFAWAKVALDSGWVCHPKYGCGLVAGYGPSGVGERPGFDWWFGGDAMMSSWALEDYGDIEGARQALRFLKDRQRADGNILHEMTQSVDLLDWFGKYHYAYYHADSTPMYLYSLSQYWRRTGDEKFLEEFWESAKKAYAYCLSTVAPEDGLMDNTKAGLAAVETGVLRGKVVKDIYLEGFWIGGLEAMTSMAAAKGEKSLAEEATQRGAKARESLEKNWWMPEKKAFTFGITADGHQTNMLGVWPSVPLAVSYEVDPQKGRLAAEALGSPELATDWGVRWLSNGDPLYEPLSYNNGSAWPFMSGFAAWAEYRQGAPLAGFATWSSIAQLTGLATPGAVPELMNGDRYLTGEFAVPHQLFSSVGVVVPAVRGVLGLESRGRTNGHDQSLELVFAPNLPADWPFLRFKRYAIGDGHVDGEILQEPGRTSMTLRYDGGVLVSAKLWPSLPAAARVKRILLDRKAVKFSTRDFGSFLRAETEAVKLHAKQQVTLSVEYEGGVGIVPVRPRPEPGERTTSLKILDVQTNLQNKNCALQLNVAGIGGRTYWLQFVTSRPELQAGGLRTRKTATGYEIEIPFEGVGYVGKQVCLGN